jgi:hypothetical protein
LTDPCAYVGVEGVKCEKLYELLASKPTRQKRAPSQYNLYVKECIKAKGGVKRFGEAGGLMKKCAAEYKEDKSKGKLRYKVEMPSQPDNPELWKGRDLRKEYADLYARISGRRKK